MGGIDICIKLLVTPSMALSNKIITNFKGGITMVVPVGAKEHVGEIVAKGIKEEANASAGEVAGVAIKIKAVTKAAIVAAIDAGEKAGSAVVDGAVIKAKEAATAAATAAIESVKGTVVEEKSVSIALTGAGAAAGVVAAKTTKEDVSVEVVADVAAKAAAAAVREDAATTNRVILGRVAIVAAIAAAIAVGEKAGTTIAVEYATAVAAKAAAKATAEVAAATAGAAVIIAGTTAGAAAGAKVAIEEVAAGTEAITTILATVKAVGAAAKVVVEAMSTTLPDNITLLAIDDWYANSDDATKEQLKVTYYKEEEKMEILQNNIANIRILAGLSPTEFAKELQITKQALHNWEKHKNKINYIQYKALTNLYQNFISYKNSYSEKRCSEDVFFKIILLIMYPEFYTKKDFAKGQDAIIMLASVIAKNKNEETIINNLAKDLPDVPKAIKEIIERLSYFIETPNI